MLDSDGVWQVLCKRRLEGPGFVDYVALEVSCSSLYIGSNAHFKFTEDSANRLPPPEGIIGFYYFILVLHERGK